MYIKRQPLPFFRNRSQTGKAFGRKYSLQTNALHVGTNYSRGPTLHLTNTIHKVNITYSQTNTTDSPQINM